MKKSEQSPLLNPVLKAEIVDERKGYTNVVNFVSRGVGYCSICGNDTDLVTLGVGEYRVKDSDRGVGICLTCLPDVIEQAKLLSEFRLKDGSIYERKQ